MIILKSAFIAKSCPCYVSFLLGLGLSLRQYLNEYAATILSMAPHVRSSSSYSTRRDSGILFARSWRSRHTQVGKPKANGAAGRLQPGQGLETTGIAPVEWTRDNIQIRKTQSYYFLAAKLNAGFINTTQSSNWLYLAAQFGLKYSQCNVNSKWRTSAISWRSRSS